MVEWGRDALTMDQFRLNCPFAVRRVVSRDQRRDNSVVRQCLIPSAYTSMFSAFLFIGTCLDNLVFSDKVSPGANVHLAE